MPHGSGVVVGLQALVGAGRELVPAYRKLHAAVAEACDDPLIILTLLTFI